MRRVVYVLLLILAGGMAWIRLAPDDPARWHVGPGLAIPPSAPPAMVPGPDSVAAVTGAAWARVGFQDMSAEEALARLDRVALATQRTRRLAGSPQTGRITWVTRSVVFGFPDYTTAEARTEAGLVVVDLHARLRYGRSDLGVNAARLEDWLARLAAP